MIVREDTIHGQVLRRLADQHARILDIGPRYTIIPQDQITDGQRCVRRTARQICNLTEDAGGGMSSLCANAYIMDLILITVINERVVDIDGRKGSFLLHSIDF